MNSQTTKLLAAILMSHSLLVVESAQCASIFGDSFNVAVTEEGVVVGVGDGIAGSAGFDVTVVDNSAFFGIVDWIDGDTFRLDFFSRQDRPLVDLVWKLDDLHFVEDGLPVMIVGLDEVSAAFEWNYTANIGAHSIEINYPRLNVSAAADGEVVVFDVLTVPEPAATPFSVAVAVWMSGWWRRRGPGYRSDIR